MAQYKNLTQSQHSVILDPLAQTQQSMVTESQAPVNIDKVYIHRDYVPVETHYKYKPDKERGYGCSNCFIF